MLNFDRFPNNKRKALTMSYDDGKTPDRRLVSIFNKYGIRGTFHINYGLLPRPERINAEELKELYSGHEVSAHGVTHQSLSITPKENMIYEIMEDRKGLERLVGYPVRGMSYPNGLYDDRVIDALKVCGIEYCRAVETTHDFRMPDDFLKWKGTCHHNQNLLELGRAFLEQPYKNRPHIMYVWGHSYEFDRDNNWDLIEDFCKMMSGKDDIWYCTNIEFVDYVNAWKSLRFSADCSLVYNPTATDVWISKNEKPIVIASGSTVKLSD